MGRYEGDPGLPQRILARDRHRCRWCGRTNAPLDVHHIRYRRSKADDVPENLISLCRSCHSEVHGLNNQRPITKQDAQEILFALIDMPAATGLALLRQRRRRKET